MLNQQRLNQPLLNQQLQDELTKAFKPLGIVAFSNCCRCGCSGNYGDNHDFNLTERGGIYFFRLYLNGMNYYEDPQDVYVYYDDFQYLTEHWESEVSQIEQWASILGKTTEEYTIYKPEDNNTCVRIHFHEPLSLEKVPDIEQEDASD
jgi:hypothetical protein